MIITISGMLGSGKTSVAKLVASRLGYRFYSTGDLMGEMAMKRGITLLELSKLAEKDRQIDADIDAKTVELGKKDDLVLDSRLGFHFLPESVKIFLKCSIDIGAKRVFKQKLTDSKARAEEAENTSLEMTKKNICTRLASEKKRYKEYYGMDDYTHASNYDVVIDTDDISIEETVDQIIDFVSKRKMRS
jgi:predicted cytidylate kinase